MRRIKGSELHVFEHVLYLREVRGMPTMHPALPGRVTIPHPVKDLPVGTWKSILRQAGLGQNEED
jgi:hypothetical protein